MAQKARPCHRAARGRAVLRRGVGATTGAVKINLQVLRADDNMHRRAIGMARREKRAKGRLR